MKLDLHGVRHYEVDRLVENFILQNQDQLPLYIVTGNSDPMQNLVVQVCNRWGCTYAREASRIIIRTI
jgi:hypothetical protein